MKNTFERTRLKPILPVLILVLTILVSCRYFQTNNHGELPLPSRFEATDTLNKLIVWRNPDSTKEQYRDWLKKFRDKWGVVSDSIFCSNCADSDLVLLSGKGPINYIQGQASSGGSGSKKSGVSGEDGPVYYSQNFSIYISPPVLSESFSDSANLMTTPPAFHNISGNKIAVAVFDTGVDSTLLSNYLYSNNQISCLGADANAGWNFSYWNKYWQDDNNKPKEHHHGTVVAGFIAKQQAAHIESGLFQSSNAVDILPVKTHDSVGSSNLFNILCGFAYAKERGAKIINASFGFYAPLYNKDSHGKPQPDSSGYLLKKFIKHYLTNNKIILVAAAGNEDPHEDIVYKPVNKQQARDLDNVHFYPASLSSELWNVIAVTTVSETTGQVSPHQNFSAKVVNIGVNADVVTGSMNDLYLFMNPFHNGQTAQGTSYAAPIFSGKLAANYSLIEPVLRSNAFTKKDILNVLVSNTNIAHQNAAFNRLIKDPIIINK